MKIVLVLLIIGVCGIGAFVFLQPGKTGPVGIVVPHHDMVADTRAAYFKEVARQVNPESVIIISPDHFDGTNESVVVSDKVWQTSVGEIYPDKDIIDSLQIPVQNEPFQKEHGITSLLKDIRQYFPEKKVVPILINRTATYEESLSLANSLYQACSACLVVASVDFSHTNDAMVADLHDEIALRGLFSMDSELLYKEAEVDSPESLVVLTSWARLHEHGVFDVFSHTNSGFLSGAKSGEMTTHIIGGYYSGDRVETDHSVTFMAAGDLSLSRGVDVYVNKQSNVLTKLGERFFWGVDVSLVNLEGYFSDDFERTVWEHEPPLLPISISHKKYIEYMRVNTANVANNHAYDGGERGIQQTFATLKNSGVEYIGDNQDISQSAIRIEQQGDVKVAFIGVYTHQPFVNLIETIERLTSTDHHVVVYAHWGEEFALESNATQKAMAHDWIDAGADLVLGSHPHVVQDFEVYRGRPIVYSLGNFMFDQDFRDEVKIGAVAGGKFQPDSLSVIIVPVNSYLEPYVIDADYEQYVTTWTRSWSEYLDETGYFTFLLE